MGLAVWEVIPSSPYLGVLTLGADFPGNLEKKNTMMLYKSFESIVTVAKVDGLASLLKK